MKTEEYNNIRTVLMTASKRKEGVKRERTANKYAHLLAEFIGIETLQKTPEEIIKKIEDLNLKISTKKLIYCAARRYLQQSNRLIEMKTLEIQKIYYTSQERQKWLTPSEVNSLLKKTKTKEENLLIKTMFMTGLRASAIIFLEKTQLKFDVNKIQIKAEKEGNKMKTDFDVTMPNKLKPELVQWCEKRNKKYVFNLEQEDGKSTEYLVQNFQKKIAEIGRRAKLKITPHYLRHTFGVMHYNWKKDILLTKEEMGQKSFEATKIYAKSVPAWEETSKKWLD